MTVPTLNLIDLTDPQIQTCEDHQMTLETDQPTTSGLIENMPVLESIPVTKKGKEVRVNTRAETEINSLTKLGGNK
jgi:hypothetical protein